jgi:UDP-glucose 4-epimerase
MASSDPHQPVILVTGAYGLLGSRVIPLLARDSPGCEIIAVRRNQTGTNGSQLKVICGDLRDEQVWLALPNTITHVLHLAAVISRKAEERYKASVVTDNLLPLANLIEHSQRWPKLRQIIYSSSVSVYARSGESLHEDSRRQPANLYGAAKLAGEELLSCMDARGVRTISLRLSSLYAYGQYEGTVLPIMVRRARGKQELLIFGDGSRTQDFLHCEDAARAILLSFQKEARGVYNVGSGTPVTMTELAQAVSRVFAGGMAQIAFQPETPDNDPGIKLDISKARRDLDYQPLIQLESGLQKLKLELDARQEKP